MWVWSHCINHAHNKMDLDSSTSSLNLLVSTPPKVPLSGITPVDSPAADKPTCPGVIVATPIIDEKPVVKKTTPKALIKPEPVGVALTRTSHRQIKRPKTDEELIDFESSSRGSSNKKTKSSLVYKSNTVSYTCTRYHGDV